MPSAVQWLFSKTARRRHRELAFSGDLVLLVDRTSSAARRDPRWQRDRRYVRSLERRALATANVGALETWLFALLVSTCPARFGRCATSDWGHAERLARTPWQRHLVRQGAAARARLNESKRARERRLVRGFQTSASTVRHAGIANDRLQVIRCYAAIAQRILDLITPRKTDSSVSTATPFAGDLQDLALRTRRRGSPSSGPPPCRRVRAARPTRSRRGGHGAASRFYGHPSAGVSPALFLG
jgi:hypothetical protein